MSAATSARRRDAVVFGLALAATLGGLPLQGQDRALRPIEVAEKRALLIGNAEYRQTTTLVNTIADVRALEGVLSELGFHSVQREENLTRAGMVAAMREFASQLDAGDLALFYYSGHGVQVNTASDASAGAENFLLPVDFDGDTLAAELPDEAYAASRVQRILRGSGAKVRVLVLDACRNNPFRGIRSSGGGLARMEAEGDLIVYSTGAGDVASDNLQGGLGLYMTHLLPELRQGRVELKEALDRTRAAVVDAARARGESQRPALYDDLIGKVYLRGEPGSAVDDWEVVRQAPQAEDRCAGYWAEVRESSDPAELQWYLGQCPEGAHRGLAEARLRRLRQSPVPAGGAREPRLGEVREFDGMEFVWVPAGEFVMGSESVNASTRADERPLTRVRISAGYWLGKYEVTQGQWQAVMGSNPSEHSSCGADCPVESLWWDDLDEFIQRMNGRARGEVYRLPTEAEWEYAARAGTTGDRYSSDLDAIAWHDGNSGGGPHPVGRKRANAFGLHDMLGNVWERVADVGDYPGGFVTDPRGRGTILRGGSWGHYPHFCRASARNAGRGTKDLVGFRLLRIRP